VDIKFVDAGHLSEEDRDLAVGTYERTIFKLCRDTTLLKKFMRTSWLA
jgi:hypothetical protein